MRLDLNQSEVNYAGTVVQITNLTPVIGLDNLVLTRIHGESVLVDKETKINDVGVFFPAESKLSYDFLHHNNLYRNSSFNRDTTAKGYFEDSGRVKSIKFKGVISTGFWIPIKAMEFAAPASGFKVGDIFHKVNNIEICRKNIRVLPTTKEYNKQVSQEANKVLFFKEHEDTVHFLRNIAKIGLHDHVVVTYKLHGTSGRSAHLPVNKELNWREKIAKFFGVDVVPHYYAYVHGSRRVTKSVNGVAGENKNHFYSRDIWSEAGKLFEGKLYKNETVFYEIIGWDGQSPIQSGYTYGLPSGTFHVYVYRISNTNPDGVVSDLPYTSMVERCKEIGVEPVPLLCQAGPLSDTLNTVEEFANLITGFLDQPSILHKETIEEGFVVSVLRGNKHEYFKIKSPKFLLHETKVADKGGEDLEESQNV